MNGVIGILALVFTAALGGMRITYGVDIWKGTERPFYRVWNGKNVYLGSVIWFVMLTGIWVFSSWGKAGIWPENQYLQAVRFGDLLATYGLLALVDAKQRIVPDRILACFFLGQMLLGGASMAPGALLLCLAGGFVFTCLMISFAWLSKGKLGMGDAKLLGVTAMTAGSLYTVQLIFVSLLISFFYGLWLLLVKRAGTKSEFPFVPCLALGMVINTIYFAL